MNGLLIVVAFVVAGNMVWGFSKGFFRVVYSLVAGILIFALTVWATPYVADFLSEHTTLDNKIEAGCKTELVKLVEGGDTNEKTEGTKKTESKKKNSEKSEVTETDIEKLKDKIPSALLDKLVEPNELVDGYLEENGVYDVLAARATTLAMKGISFLLLLVAISVIFGVLAAICDFVTKLPLLETANQILGLVAGLIRGILMVWLAFAVVALGSATEIGRTVINMIYESQILIWVYENNILLNLLMKFL